MKQIILLSTLLLFLFVAPACALDLDSAKAQGLVGETANGYLAPVVSPTPEVAQLVESINTRRKVKYQEIADANHITLAVVEQLAGKKAIQKTASGEYVNESGKWRKK